MSEWPTTREGSTLYLRSLLNFNDPIAMTAQAVIVGAN